MLRRNVVGVAAVSLMVVGVTLWRSSKADAQLGDNSGARVAPTLYDARIPYGQGRGEVGLLRPQGDEQVVEGPSAIAFDSKGRALILDRINARVVELMPDGSASEAWPKQDVSADSVDLDVADDGTIGAFSELHSHVKLYANGSEIGAVHVPRELRNVSHIVLGTSHQVSVTTAFQERYRVGSPTIRPTLATVLHSKREGVARLPSGMEAATETNALGEAFFLALSEQDGRSTVVQRLAVAKDAWSATVVAAHEATVCVLVERGREEPELKIGREVVCLNADRNEIVLRAELPAVGSYVPRRPFALGGSPLRLAFLHPADDALHVLAWRVPETSGGAQ